MRARPGLDAMRERWAARTQGFGPVRTQVRAVASQPYEAAPATVAASQAPKLEQVRHTPGADKGRALVDLRGVDVSSDQGSLARSTVCGRSKLGLGRSCSVIATSLKAIWQSRFVND